MVEIGELILNAKDRVSSWISILVIMRTQCGTGNKNIFFSINTLPKKKKHKATMQLELQLQIHIFSWLHS